MKRPPQPIRRAPSALLGLALGLGLLLPAHHSAQAATTTLAGGTIHTASGPALTNAWIHVRDGRIVAVDAAPAPEPPADTRVDLHGLHLYPGLIAADTVLGLIEIEGVRATRDNREVGTFRPDVFAWVAIHPDSDLIPVARANGFTHVESTPQGGVVSGFSAVIHLDGWTSEQMTLNKAAALHLHWPEFGLDPTPKDQSPNPARWKSPEDQIRDRNNRLQEIDDFFRDAAAYAAARKAALGDLAPLPAPGDHHQRPPTPADFALVPAWEALLPVLQGQTPVFLHAEEAPQIRSAVEWALGRNLKPVVVGARDAARIAPWLAQLRIPVVYEHVHTLPVRDTDPYDVQFTAPATLSLAGVQVSFGGGATRYGAANLRNLPYTAAQAVAFGLEPLEALRGLTLYPARILGVADRLGSIEPGKDATFFIANGDILDVRTQVRRLWIAGQEVSLESRHTRLYERYRNRPQPR